MGTVEKTAPHLCLHHRYCRILCPEESTHRDSAILAGVFEANNWAFLLEEQTRHRKSCRPLKE